MEFGRIPCSARFCSKMLKLSVKLDGRPHQTKGAHVISPMGEWAETAHGRVSTPEILERICL